MTYKDADKQREYQREYQKRNLVKKISFRFNTEKDADILAHLDRQDNKAGYIKELIRKDMEGSWQQQ